VEPGDAQHPTMILRGSPSGNDQSDALCIDKVNFRKIKQNRCNTARLRGL